MKPGSRSQIGGNVKEKHICTNFARLLCPDFVFVNFDEDLLASLFHFQVPHFSLLFFLNPSSRTWYSAFPPTPHTKCRSELKENERQVLIVVWRNSNCLYAKPIFFSLCRSEYSRPWGWMKWWKLVFRKRSKGDNEKLFFWEPHFPISFPHDAWKLRRIQREQTENRELQ